MIHIHNFQLDWNRSERFKWVNSYSNSLVLIFHVLDRIGHLKVLHFVIQKALIQRLIQVKDKDSFKKLWSSSF